MLRNDSLSVFGDDGPVGSEGQGCVEGLSVDSGQQVDDDVKVFVPGQGRNLRRHIFRVAVCLFPQTIFGENQQVTTLEKTKKKPRQFCT